MVERRSAHPAMSSSAVPGELLSTILRQEPTYYDAAKACKYLGKIYIDRTAGVRPPKDMVHKACRVVQHQAPKKNKLKVMFMTTDDSDQGDEFKPGLLVGCDEEDNVIIKVPLINVSAAGSIESLLYFATMEKSEDDVCRYWIMVFKCRTEKRAFATAENIICKCREVHAAEKLLKNQQHVVGLPETLHLDSSSAGPVEPFSPRPLGSLNDSGASNVASPSASESSVLSMSDSPMSVMSCDSGLDDSYHEAVHHANLGSQSTGPIKRFSSNEVDEGGRLTFAPGIEAQLPRLSKQMQFLMQASAAPVTGHFRQVSTSRTTDLKSGVTRSRVSNPDRPAGVRRSTSHELEV